MALQVAGQEAGQETVTSSCRRVGAARSATWSKEDAQTVFGLECIMGSGARWPDNRVQGSMAIMSGGVWSEGCY